MEERVNQTRAFLNLCCKISEKIGKSSHTTSNFQSNFRQNGYGKPVLAGEPNPPQLSFSGIISMYALEMGAKMDVVLWITWTPDHVYSASRVRSTNSRKEVTLERIPLTDCAAQDEAVKTPDIEAAGNPQD